MFPKFFICGIEYSDTTLISVVFKQMLGIDVSFAVERSCSILCEEQK